MFATRRPRRRHIAALVAACAASATGTTTAHATATSDPFVPLRALSPPPAVGDPGTFSPTVQTLRAPSVNGQALVFASGLGSDDEAWSLGTTLVATDGTASGTKVVATFPQGRKPTDSVRVGDRVYFVLHADDHAHLWWTDGQTAEELTLPGERNGISNLTPVGDRLFFALDSADLGGTASRLAVLNGTSITMTKVDGTIQNMTASGQGVTFWLNDTQASTAHLWRSDGRRRGTFAFPPNLESPVLSTPLLTSGRLVYFVRATQRVQEVWRTDGTPRGTFRLSSSSVPSLSGTDTVPVVGARGEVYFFASDGTKHGTGLWQTDGTRKRTQLTQTLGPQRAGMEVVRVGRSIAFTSASASGSRLWRTAGTQARASVLAEVADGSAFSHSIRTLTEVDGRLLYASLGATGRYGLWESGGTKPTTHPSAAAKAAGIVDPATISDVAGRPLIAGTALTGDSVLFSGPPPAGSSTW